MVQWLRLHASSTGDVGLILLSVAKTQKEKKNLSCNAFSKINTKKNYTVSSEMCQCSCKYVAMLEGRVI